MKIFLLFSRCRFDLLLEGRSAKSTRERRQRRMWEYVHTSICLGCVASPHTNHKGKHPSIHPQSPTSTVGNEDRRSGLNLLSLSRAKPTSKHTQAVNTKEKDAQNKVKQSAAIHLHIHCFLLVIINIHQNSDDLCRRDSF